MEVNIGLLWRDKSGSERSGEYVIVTSSMRGYFGNAVLYSERGQEDVSHFLPRSLNNEWQVLSSISEPQ